jgi:DNA-binding NtrC family response regulator
VATTLDPGTIPGTAAVPGAFDDDEDALDPTWRPQRISSTGPAYLGEEAGEVSVRPYRTGQPFDKASLIEGLRQGKLQGSAQFGLIQFLSTEDDDDVRVVLGRQGEVRIRRYDPDHEEVEFWTLPQALTDTVAIRYSGDPATGLLRFTMFGGGKIPDVLIDWFQERFARISRNTPVADGLEATHVRQRCFETGFLQRLYSIQAQLDAEGYETIDHTRFKSRQYINPDCKRIREFRAAERLLIEAFESEVEVKTEDLQREARIRFTVRTESGNIRLMIPRLQYRPTIRDVSAHTRAFYGLCERAFAEIVGQEAPVAAHLDPGSDNDTFLAAVCDVRRHRAFLSAPGNRARFFQDLDQSLPKGRWLPHLRAIDEMMASISIGDLAKVLDRLADDDPEQAIMLLSTARAQRLHRLGSTVCEAVVRRLATLPRALWPVADDALLAWAVDDEALAWTYDPNTDVVLLYGVPYAVSRLPSAFRARVLLRCARDGHRRLLVEAPDSSGAGTIHAAVVRTAAFEPQETDPPAVHHIRSRVGRGGDLLPALVGSEALSGTDATTVALRLHGVPLWPLLTPSSVEGRRVLTNTGLGFALALRLGDHGLGDLAPGATLEVPEDAEGVNTLSFRCFEKEWSLTLAPAQAGAAIAVYPPTLLMAKRKLAEFRKKADPGRKVLGQSAAIWQAIEEAYFAHRQEPRPHVLIEGETGTGKSELARMLHLAADLGEEKFIRVTGSTFAGSGDEHAQRGALFGYAPDHGFDGIDRKGKKGAIELAAGGTLFVDDFEALPARVQHALLDVLSGEDLWMEGGAARHRIRASCRVILATNAGARALVDTGVVRNDLLARVGGRVSLPPLRDRIADAFEIVRAIAPESQRFSARAWWALLQHSWPENVRELLKVIKSATVVARESEAAEIDARHLRLLPTTIRQAASECPEDDAERFVVLAAERLARDEGFEHGARGRGLSRRIAEVLGLSETVVSHRLKRFRGTK